MSSHTVIIDDTDPRVEYTRIELGPARGKGFTSLINQPENTDAGPIYNGTLARSDVFSVSAILTFTGTQVSVFGSLRPVTVPGVTLPQSAYSIPDFDYGGILSMKPYDAPNVTSPKNNVNFFTSDPLPLRVHTLVINVTNAYAEAPFLLDYFAIEVPGPAPSSTSVSSTLTTPTASVEDSTSTSPSPSTSTASSSTSSLPSSSFSTSSSSQSSNPTNSPAAAIVTGSSTSPVGVIVGVTVGGVLLLAAVIFAVFFYLRRRRGRGNLEGYDNEEGKVTRDGSEPQITPFVDPSQGIGVAQTGGNGMMFIPGRPEPTESSTSPINLNSKSPAMSLPVPIPAPTPAPASPPGESYASNSATSPIGDNKRAMATMSAFSPQDAPAGTGTPSAEPHVEHTNSGAQDGGQEDLPPVYSR